MGFILLLLFLPWAEPTSIDLLDQSSMGPHEPNYCNNTHLLEAAGIIQSTLGQFLGYECSAEFFHCRWQSDGFRTYKKNCRVGLVYDTLGTQNCNYDYNVKGCKMAKGGACNSTQFTCSMSESCVPLASRCDGRYDCAMEEDEHNCPMCAAGEFACLISEQCVPLERRCNGQADCNDGSDEWRCDVCGAGRFLCGKSGECVDGEKRCDGERNCPHGEDEILCRQKPLEKLFTCRSRDAQVSMNQVCDGRPDCPDESDELYCEPANPPPVSLPMSLSSLISQARATAAPEEEEEEEEDDDEDETSTESARAGPLFPVLSVNFPFTAKPQPRTTTRPTVTRATVTRATVPPTLATVPQSSRVQLKSNRATVPAASMPTLRPMTSLPTVSLIPGASSSRAAPHRPTVILPTVTGATVIRPIVTRPPTVIPPVRQSAWRTTTEGAEERRNERPGTVGLLPSTVEMLVTATSPPLIVYEKAVTIPARVRTDEDDEMQSTIITSHLVTERVAIQPTASRKPAPTTLLSQPSTQPTRTVYQHSAAQRSTVTRSTVPPTTTTRLITTTTTASVDTARRGHYPTRVDSSEEQARGERKQGGPRNQVARSLPDTRPVELPLEERRVSNPRVLSMKFNDDHFNEEIRISTSTPAAKSTKSIVDAELLKKIGAKLNLHSGKAISSRSLLTKIEEVLREELPARVSEAKKEGRSLRSLGNPPRTEKDHLDLRIATLKVFTDEKLTTVQPSSPPSTVSTTTITATSSKPRFSFRIMEERPTTQPVKRLSV